MTKATLGWAGDVDMHRRAYAALLAASSVSRLTFGDQQRIAGLSSTMLLFWFLLFSSPLLAELLEGGCDFSGFSSYFFLKAFGLLVAPLFSACIISHNLIL
jgi:hypothetical protein